MRDMWLHEMGCAMCGCAARICRRCTQQWHRAQIVGLGLVVVSAPTVNPMCLGMSEMWKCCCWACGVPCLFHTHIEVCAVCGMMSIEGRGGTQGMCAISHHGQFVRLGNAEYGWHHEWRCLWFRARSDQVVRCGGVSADAHHV